ncbi:MAG: MBL fold metallo-hydrolase [Sutterellaceae bacterium]|nr:MBL fold metallo-hydrolase [Sutterellaceae bacterium]
MKKTLGLLCGLLFLSANCLAADISTYTVGDMKIVRIVDGENGVPVDKLNGDKTLIRKLVPSGFCPNLITSYVLQTPDGVVLIDSGFGDFEPSRMLNNFKQAGFVPDDVKTVVLTHLHGDHIDGLMTGDTKVFKNATVFVNDVELAFWKDKANKPKVPESMRFCFEAVEKLVRLYGKQLKTFKDGEKVVPWLTPINVAGHTPGHTMFELDYDGQKRFIWADVIHCMDVQVRHPEVSAVFDTDEQAAVRARIKALDLVSDTDVPVFGGHFTNPGVGKFYKLPEGGYRFVPLQ